VENNNIITSKTQELVLYNDEYKVYIPLNKGMSGTYTEAPNQSSDKESNDGSDSIGLNDLYALNARKELDGFLDYIKPMDDGQFTFHSGSVEIEFRDSYNDVECKKSRVAFKTSMPN